MVEVINWILFPIGMGFILLLGFGMLTGVKTDRLVTTYINFLVQILVVIGEVLTKLAIPVLKQIGEKIAYTANHYLAEHKTSNPSIAKPSEPINLDSKPAASDSQAVPPVQSTPNETKEPKANSANPYDDPPAPEIMD